MRRLRSRIAMAWSDILLVIDETGIVDFDDTDAASDALG